MLDWTGERFIPGVGSEIAYEHYGRYLLASRFVASKRVLDMPSGEGFGSFLLAQTARAVVGIDIDEQSLTHARACYRHATLDFQWGDMTKAIPLPSASFDVITCFEGIEHIDSDSQQRAISEFHRLLTPGGMLFISTPNKAVYSDAQKYHNPYHVHEFYFQEFCDFLSPHFPHMRLLGQMSITGGLIAALNERLPQSTKQIDIDFLLPFDRKPLSELYTDPQQWTYFIAVCTNEASVPAPIIMNHLVADPQRSSIREALDSATRQLTATHRAEQSAALAHTEALLADRDRALEHLQTTLHAQEATLAHQQAMLTDKNRALEHLQTTLHTHEATLAHQQAMLADKDQALEHLRATLHAQEAALAHQRISTADMQRRMTIYEAERQTFGAQVGRWLSQQRQTWAAPGTPQGKAISAMLQAARTLYGQGIRHAARKIIEIAVARVYRKRRPTVAWLRTCGLFDAAYYLSTYPNVAALRMDPAKHYLRIGWKEACNPHPLFDASYYLQYNPDVAQAEMNPLWHYATFGWQEGRDPHALFDTSFYLEHNPDVAQAGVNPLWHYAIAGQQEGRETRTRSITFAEGAYEPEMFPALGTPAVKLIAFYLPQFHPIPENDQWWGKGFTEWTNVSKAQPLFPGHYQPHLPGELGFYDLRLVEVVQRQIALAKQYGLYGFCFYLYWFHGKRLLEKPVEQFLAHPELDFPFCLCWANENWTRRWDGQDREILMAQQYSPADDLAFIRDVEPYLRDSRYIRIDGKPLLLVYNPGRLPDAQATVKRWRDYCRSTGIGELFLALAQTFGIADPRPFGFDAAVEFPPHAPHVTGTARVGTITHAIPFFEPTFSGVVHDYADILRAPLPEPTEYVVFKGVMPGWDNTARTGKRARIFVNSSPHAFQTWLTTVAQWTVQHQAPAQRLVFMNAWNEWAEGAHLEPDRKYGYAYLNATARALQQATPKIRVPKKHTVLFVSHDAIRAGAQILLLDLLRWLQDKTAIRPKVLLGAGGPLEHVFRDITDVLLLDDLLAQEPRSSALEVRLRDYCGPDLKLIYANTAVSGKYLEHLAFLQVPVVTHVHELQTNIEQFAGRETMDKLLHYTQHYIAVSSPVYDNLRTTYHIAPEQMSLIYEFSGKEVAAASDQGRDEIRAALRLDAKKTLILGCGFVHWRKGPDLFVAVAEQLLNKGLCDFHCCWIGKHNTGECTDLIDHIRERGLQKYITFVGEKDDPQAYFMAGDIFLLPSREDPFPLVCLEAAACGLPIICFADAGGMPDFVEEDAGFVVAYEDVTQMADKVAQLITDRSLRRTLGNRAQEKFLARHTLDQTAPAILKSIQKVAGIAPALSVIVPVYNHAPFLRQRLESIFQQTFQDLEVILLDDGSTDGGLAIAQEYASRPNVRLEVNTCNQGVFAQWLKGLCLATADLIWIAEDDDFCEADFLATLLPFFDDPDTQIAYCNSHAVDAGGTVTRDVYLQHYYHTLSEYKWHQDYINVGAEEVNQGLAIKNTIPNVSAVVFRKPENLEAIIPELRQMRCTGDWLFYLHLLKQGKIAYSSRSLNYHRRHQNSVVARNVKTAEYTIPDYYRVHQYVLRHYAVAPDVFARMVRFVEQELRSLFPELGDDELLKLYDSQALRTLYSAH